MDDPEADPWPARIQGGIPRRELLQSLVQIFNVFLPQKLQRRLVVRHTGALEVAVHFGNFLLQCMLLRAGVGDQTILDHLASRLNSWHRTGPCSTLNCLHLSHQPSCLPESASCQHMARSEVNGQSIYVVLREKLRKQRLPLFT